MRRAGLVATAFIFTVAACDEVTPTEIVVVDALSCGGENLNVAFEDTRVLVFNTDGSRTELALLPPAPDATNATYTDGRLTFTKEGGGDTPTLIRFARGRMAFQDCAAMN